jgi:6-phosphogluconolactonase
MTQQATRVTRPSYLLVVSDLESLQRDAVQEFSTCAQGAVRGTGRFCVALAGGNTPRGVYELLAKQGAGLPWDKIHVFFGDERHVPPDHADSNYRMAGETLLSKVAIPEGNVHRVPAELEASAAAAAYEKTLRDFFRLQPGAFPHFDLILLGMGDDGHTASLFPGSKALTEKSRLVVANAVEKLNGERITLTLPVLNHAANVVFMVSGASKAPVLRNVFDTATTGDYPARLVRPVNGRLLWIADRAAASLFNS